MSTLSPFKVPLADLDMGPRGAAQAPDLPDLPGSPAVVEPEPEAAAPAALAAPDVSPDTETSAEQVGVGMHLVLRPAEPEAEEFEAVPLGQHTALVVVPTSDEDDNPVLILDATDLTPAQAYGLLMSAAQVLAQAIEDGHVHPEQAPIVLEDEEVVVS